MANTTLIKTILRNSIAEGIYKEITNRSGRYFYFLGKTLTWQNELAPLSPIDSITYDQSTRNEIITVKEITPTDVAFVVPRYEWKTGIIYDQYDDQYSTEIQGINLKSGGSEYAYPPYVYIGSNGNTPFMTNTAYTIGQLVKAFSNYYIVTIGGISDDLYPSHTTGTEVNGGVSLQYVTVRDENGSDATATAVLTDSIVTSIEMTNRGIGYTSEPTVIIAGIGNDTFATGAAVITKGPKSKKQKIEDCEFYVITDEHNVYVCLDNYNNAISTYKPVDTDFIAHTYPDGYVWKFMYNVPIGLRNKFLTASYVPVVTSIQDQFYSNGNIQAVRVDTGGEGYIGGSISVIGDGYRESNPLYIYDLLVTAGGGAYTNPKVSIDSSFTNVVPWSPSYVAVVGQKYSYLNNIYEISVSGSFGTIGPVHKYGTVSNGTTSLKYIGTTASAIVTGHIFTGVSIANTSGEFTCSPSTMAVGQTVTIHGTYGGTGSIVGYSNPTTYKISATDTTTTFTLQKTDSLSGVQITGTAGEFSCSATTLSNGQEITISGTYGIGSSGSIVGYSNPTTYKISATNGTTTFTLQTLLDIAIVTTVGTPIGLTYTNISNYVPIVTTVGTPTGLTYVGGHIDGTSIYRIALNLNVRDIDITINGSGYTSTPTVTIDNQFNTGAGAFAVLAAGTVTKIIVSDSGKDYIDSPTITIGTQWTGTTVVTLGQQIFYETNLYTVTGAGTTGVMAPVHATGFASNGTSVLTYAGEAAKASCTLKSGAGYSIQPVATITGGSGAETQFSSVKSEAKLIPIFLNGQLTNIQIDDGGVGYTYAVLTVTGDGTGATATAQLSIGDANSLQSNIELLAVDGGIHNISVISGGYGYITDHTTVTIIGDGSGATATVKVVDGKIIKINITNAGRGYRWATATLVGAGIGGKLRVIISPVGGHGKEAINNLYARTLMFYSNVSADKNQGFNVNNDYRQLGILKNPRQYGVTYNLTTSNASACWVISADSAIDEEIFPIDSILYLNFGASNEARFRIVSYSGAAILAQSLDNGIPTLNATLQNSLDHFIITTVTPPTMDKYSGDLLFIDNKQAFTPSEDQIVTIRTVLKF